MFLSIKSNFIVHLKKYFRSCITKQNIKQNLQKVNQHLLPIYLTTSLKVIYKAIKYLNLFELFY